MTTLKIKRKIAYAAIGVAIGTATMQAQADAVWLPYYTVGNGTYTFLTIRADGDGDISGISFPDDVDNPVHYHWYYKEDPTDNLEACNKLNAFGFMSDFDIIQQSVIDDLDLPTAFGDLSQAAYLTVSPTYGQMILQDSSPEGSLGADAVVVDFNVNLYASYKGINQFFGPVPPAQNTPIVSVGTPNPPTSFTVPFSAHWSYDLTWYPLDVVDTAWWVPVSGPVMTTQPAGNWAGAVSMVQAFGGVIDRDENYYSGQKPHPVVCYDWVTLGDILDAGQIANIELGGYLWETTIPPVFAPGSTTVVNPAFPSGGANVWKFLSINFGIPTGPSGFFGPENAFPNLPY